MVFKMLLEEPEAVGSDSRNPMPKTVVLQMAQKLAGWLLRVVWLPQMSLLAEVQKTAIGVRKDMCLFFEVGSPFAETGSTHLLAVGEPLRSALCLPRMCRVQGVCMGSAQWIRNLQGTLGAGVVDGYPTRSRTPPTSPTSSMRV